VLSESDLVAWGMRIGAESRPPLVIALRGDLGAGKTTLARSIIRGAGVSGAIPSPTYNLLLRYSAPRGVNIVHADLYRLESESEVWPLGWADLPGEDEILLIEWPERAEGLLPADRWEIALAEVDDPDQREVSVRPAGEPAPLPASIVS
jgi:tRNA threonylcarbamoyl adenosine modification protein YjeE